MGADRETIQKLLADGVMHHAEGRLRAAEEAFETALRLEPQCTEAAVNLSIVYNESGKYDQARAVFTNAVGPHAGAIAAWEQVLRDDPDNETAQIHLRAIRDGQTPED